MNNYTDHSGDTWTITQSNTYLSQDLYTDLVAAIHIARAYQERCERLEAELARIKAELDRLELVS